MESRLAHKRHNPHASFFGVAHTDGFDWIKWALSLIAAIIAISVYMAVTGRKQ